LEPDVTAYGEKITEEVEYRFWLAIACTTIGWVKGFPEMLVMPKWLIDRNGAAVKTKDNIENGMNGILCAVVPTGIRKGRFACVW
jgi:hypothetical protein